MAADPARIAAARVALAELGVTIADLQQALRPRVPTFAEYLPRVMAAAGPGALKTYGPTGCAWPPSGSTGQSPRSRPASSRRSSSR